MRISKQVLLVLFFATVLSNQTLIAQCKLAQLISQNKAKILPPYKYDGFSYFNFDFAQEKKLIKKEFVAFKDQKYQLVFCASDFEENISIQVFDTKDNSLVTSTSIGENLTVCTFEPPKTVNYSIVYDIPPSNTSVVHDGCIAMLIGYQEK